MTLPKAPIKKNDTPWGWAEINIMARLQREGATRKEAADALGRSWQSVAAKARREGISFDRPWTEAQKRELTRLCRLGTVTIAEAAEKIGRTREGAAYQAKLLGLEWRPAKRWSAAELDRLRQVAKTARTRKEAADVLGRTVSSVCTQAIRHGIKWELCSRRAWTKVDVAKLWTLAETHTQRQAAKILGRDWKCLATKAKRLGIPWGQGKISLNKIASAVGCSANTARRMVEILYPDDVDGWRSGHRASLRYRIPPGAAERICKILEGTLAHRGAKIRAGRERAKQAAKLLTKTRPRR